MSTRSWRHLRLCSVVVLEMRMENHCEPLFAVAAEPALTNRCRLNWRLDCWMEMRWIALLIVREARAAVGRRLRTRHVVATRRGTSVAVIAGNLLRCACRLHRCVALNLTEAKKWMKLKFKGFHWTNDDTSKPAIIAFRFDSSALRSTMCSDYFFAITRLHFKAQSAKRNERKKKKLFLFFPDGRQNNKMKTSIMEFVSFSPRYSNSAQESKSFYYFMLFYNRSGEGSKTFSQLFFMITTTRWRRRRKLYFCGTLKIVKDLTGYQQSHGLWTFSEFSGKGFHEHCRGLFYYLCILLHYCLPSSNDMQKGTFSIVEVTTCTKSSNNKTYHRWVIIREMFTIDFHNN